MKFVVKLRIGNGLSKSATIPSIMSGSDLPNLENLPPLPLPSLLLAIQKLLVKSRIRLRLNRTANKVTAWKAKSEILFFLCREI